MSGGCSHRLMNRAESIESREMAIRPIEGFPLAEDYGTTRVPNAVLGRVLASIDDAVVIKVILRAVWLLERQRGYPRFISAEDLRRDRVLVRAFEDSGEIDRGLQVALQHGVLVEVSIGGRAWLMLNTESAKRAALEPSSVQSMGNAVDEVEDDGWDEPARAPGVVDAFRAYEENIGSLSPMIRESILNSLEDFTDEDITQAIRIAVENESRSWSFVAGVLRRWSREGVPSEQRPEQLEGRTNERGFSEAQFNRYINYLRRQQRNSGQS